MLRSLVAPWFALVLASPGCGLLLDYDPPTDAPSLDVPGSDVSGLDAAPLGCMSDGECPTPPGSACAPQCVEGRCGLSCPNCMDLDGDGFGTGAGCAGPDCDDADPSLQDRGARPCGGRGGVGTCRAGLQSCLEGLWSPCLDEVTPVAEVCNGLDDDCNGTGDDLPPLDCGLGVCRASVDTCTPEGTPAFCSEVTSTGPDPCDGGDEDCDGVVDEDCDGCVWVSVEGRDESANPRSLATPMRTVQAAIDWAADPANGAPLRVCLLGPTDTSCPDACAPACSRPDLFRGDVTLRAGIAVSGGWVRDRTGAPRQCRGLRSTIAPDSADGIWIESAAEGASLSNLRVVPASGSRSIGITISGAVGIVIAGVEVAPALAVPGDRPNEAYGVNIVSGAEATITGSSISASNASGEAIGVRVEEATARLVDNCPPEQLDAGRCTAACEELRSQGLQGAPGAPASEPSARSTAVLFRSAPGSSVLGSAVCAGAGRAAVGVEVEGDASGILVGGSTIAGTGGEEGYGVRIGDCAETSLTISENVRISAGGTDSAAVFAEGASRPVISDNDEIVAGVGAGSSSTGVHCGPGAACVIVRNQEILGAPASPLIVGADRPQAVGVRCSGGCALVSDNRRIVGGLGSTAIGLELLGAGPRVARNLISGGCGAAKSIGVWATAAAARLESNLIFAATSEDCGLPTTTVPAFIALWVDSSSPPSLLDVRSNDLFAPRFPVDAVCFSYGIYLTSGGGGLFRGNIIDGGTCNSSFAVFETDASADPIGFSYNDLVPGPLVLYQDEAAMLLRSAAEIDALTDALCRGNLDVDPGFAAPGDFHLASGSPCIDADLGLSHPVDDHEGTRRDASPDIGAYEFVP